MKNLLPAIIVLLCSYSGNLYAQTKLHITLLNDKKETVQNATAVLYHLPDSVSITKTVSPGLSFDVENNTAYHLTVSAVGMQTIDRRIMITNKSVNMNLSWKTKVNSLENVTVVSRKPIITQVDDKTVVDAEVLASSSTNAYEVLEKTPSIIVDQDGNVYLNSATPAQVYINGREVKLSSADLASLLKSLPANSITKIEILRNPSAKYDAASSGGIVNIVLKKGVKIGINGSLNAGWFQGKYNTKTAGFNVNKGGSKANSYLSYQFTDRNNYEELSSKRFITSGNSALTQKSFTTYPGHNNYLGLGTNIELSKKWSVSYDGRLSINNNNSHAVNNNDINDLTTQNLTAQTQSQIHNHSSTTYIGNEIETEFKFDTLGSQWDFEIEYSTYRSDNDQFYANIFTLPVSSVLTGDGNTINNKNIFTTKTDLVWKLKSKYTIEAGAKYNRSDSRNSAIYYNEFNYGGQKIDSFQTNRFKYKEQISSAYLQVAKTFYGFTVKPGLRMETTDINGHQLFPKDTTLSIKRTDFFPYVYLRHNLFKLMGFMLTGNAIYRRSIARPYYEALNPYPKFIDQFLYEVGNPRLSPQFTTNYEFNIMADDFPVFSIGVNDIKNIFTNVTYQDDVTKIAYRTFDNLGRNKEMYLRIVGGIPPGGKYFFYMGAQHNRSHYTGLYQNKPLEYTRGSWVFFMYHNYKPIPTFNVSVNGFMRLRGLQNFYELKSFGQLNLNFNKAILKKKANVILAVNDVFKTNKVDFNISQSGINAFGSRVNDTRRVGLTLRYNFGIRPKEENNQTFDQPEESK